MRAAALVLAAALAVPAAASAGLRPGDSPPICAADAFTDVVGTPADDTLISSNRAERVYGLRGEDRILGSRTRATCLFGGAGHDALNLNAGGGVAWGEEGGDIIYGSTLGDVVDGGPATDLVGSGAGDDRISVRDGTAEIVNCGDGGDIVRADRADVLIACESVTATGRPGNALAPRPRVTDIGGTVRARFTAPRRGTYRVLYVTVADGRNCSGGPSELAAYPQVARRERVPIVLERPERGWCEGISRAVVVRDPADGRPPAPVARIQFRVL